MSDAAELAAYLGAHPPFRSMTPQARAELATTATEHDFGAGELIVDYLTHTPDAVWIVRTGLVALVAGAGGAVEHVDSIEPGGVFGYVPLLTGGRIAFAARALEPSTVIRLPGEPVRSIFSKPAGLSYLAASAWDTISARSRAEPAAVQPVSEWIPGPPLILHPDTSVRDAVKEMTDVAVSYALAQLPTGELGIFTDRDLRTRVVTAGVGLDAPLTQVMSVPARTTTADRTAAAVLMDMLEDGVGHMPVRDQRGAVIGVVEERDLVASGTGRSFVLRRNIALAKNAAELRTASREVTGLAVDLFRTGTDAAGTSAVLSVVVDAVVRRALDLALQSPASSEAAEPRPTDFAWMTLGSIARREAMPSSDVDSALSWTAESSPDAGALRQLAADVHTTLDQCGLPADTNGAVASSTRFARSAPEWAAAAADWLHDPLADRGIIMSSLLLDARVIWGDPTLNTVAAAFARMAVDHPHALRLQLLDALSGKPRTRSMRDVLARRGGTFDLKSHALTPIVNLARWAGLTGGMVLGSTVARLDAGAERGTLTDADATVLREVFDLVQRLRMAHQIDQLAAGVTPGDVITMSELSPLSRSLLGDGVREVAAVQRRVRSRAHAAAGRASITQERV